MRKDLGILLEEARRNYAGLPIATLVDQYCAVQKTRRRSRWNAVEASSLVSGPERPSSRFDWLLFHGDGCLILVPAFYASLLGFLLPLASAPRRAQRREARVEDEV